jgi:hypothetical protein
MRMVIGCTGAGPRLLAKKPGRVFPEPGHERGGPLRDCSSEMHEDAPPVVTQDFAD